MRERLIVEIQKMFILWHQIKMEKITIFICAMTFTFPLNVFLFYLKIIYTKVKFHPSKSRYTKYFPEDKTQTNLNNWVTFGEKHPKIFIAMYQFWVSKTKNWQFPQNTIFNFVEKTIFLGFLHEDADKVTKQTRDKQRGLNPCYFVP